MLSKIEGSNVLERTSTMQQLNCMYRAIIKIIQYNKKLNSNMFF